MKEQYNNWYVITGGPSTGKTTLLGTLQDMGHEVIPEAARTVIDEGLAKGLSIEQIRADEKHFQHSVLDRKILIEARHDKSVLTFFDRGIHDTLAYMRHYAWEIEEHIRRATENAHYKKVFLLEPLHNFVADYARTESPDFVEKINEHLFHAYNESGYTPMRVPVMEPEKRALYVLQHISQDVDAKAIA